MAEQASNLLREQHAASTIDFQHTPEQLEASISLLHSQEYYDGFLDVVTQPEQTLLMEHAAHGEKELMRRVAQDIDTETATRLGVSVDEGRKRGKDWAQARKEVSAVQDETGKSFEERLREQHAPAVFTESFQAESEQLESRVSEAAERASEALEAVLADIELRITDPDFLEAVSFWANTPNANGEFGEDGTGFNGGIIHFFEYRGSRQKAGRFQVIPEEFSVGGFISYTKRMYALLSSITERDSTEGIRGAILADDEGNERVFSVGPAGDKVIGFRRNNGETYQITSVIVGQNPDKLGKDIDKVLQGEDKGVLNKLNGPATLIYKTE